MDDSNSTGTIIYIIIMILVFVGSALKKKKKGLSGKKSAPPIPSSKTQATPASKFSNFISGLIEEASPKAEQPFYQYETDFDDNSSEITEEFDEQPPNNYSTEGISAFSEDDPSTSIIETGIEKNLSTTKHKLTFTKDKHYYRQESENELKQVLSDFDLKKAIIFSEILKPKYFKVNDF
ncbi:MAG: hypothetical protein DRI73_01460 [Bacteroidetes bacterium]|nr:MAG: hypothetical protein DRI73_01460 [Bacteroidota bacterium]